MKQIEDVGPNAGKFKSKYCGEGVYLAPKIEICMDETHDGAVYTKPIKIGDDQCIVVLQCRVEPDKIRVPDDCDEQEWIINDPKHVRPVGLVIKKLTEQEAQDLNEKGWFDDLAPYELKS